MKFKTTLLIILINSFSFYVFSQSYSYTLKQNIVKASKCDNPKNGFILTGQTVSHSTNNDSFSLDIDKELFIWSDSKGTTKNKIYNFKSKTTSLNTQYVFMTEYNLIRITTNPQKEAVIEIICSINNEWQCLSYLCYSR